MKKLIISMTLLTAMGASAQTQAKNSPYPVASMTLRADADKSLHSWEISVIKKAADHYHSDLVYVARFEKAGKIHSVAIDKSGHIFYSGITPDEALLMLVAFDLDESMRNEKVRADELLKDNGVKE